jgi:hypothetical protein
MFQARCVSGAPFTLQFRIVLLNSTQFAGQTATFDVDGTLFSAVVGTNGTHSRAQVQLVGQAAGAHTITLVEPAGCFNPMVVTCGSGASGGAEWEAFDRAWQSGEQFGKVSPKKTQLLGNYPNPFNPSTVISYEIATDAHVAVSVYNMLGERVASLVDQHLTAGSYNVVFDARNLPTGIYLYELRVDGQPVYRKKALLVK